MARVYTVEAFAKRPGGDEAAVLWPLDTALWAEKVCFAAGRNLTEAEWTKYFPGRDYEVTCDQWPAKPKI